MALDGAISWSDVFTIVGPTVAAALTIYGWATTQFNELRKDHALFREEVAKEYVSQSTLEKFESRLLAAIDRLGDRLDSFVDTKKD